MHGFTQKCNGGRVTCNCGAAVRSGDDVIVFTACNTKGRTTRGALKVNVYLNGDLTKGTTISQFKGGKEFEVRCCIDYDENDMRPNKKGVMYSN